MTTNHAYVTEMADEELTEAISLRITPADRETLNRLAARYPLKALTIARIALRIGMAEIGRNPSALFVGPHLQTSEDDELAVDAAKVRRELASGASPSNERVLGAAFERAKRMSKASKKR